MLLRNILALGLVFSSGLAFAGNVNSNKCIVSLQRKLRSVDTTLNKELNRLSKVLGEIKTPEELKVYLADPKAGGKDGRKDFFFLEAYGQILRHYKKGEGIRNNFREIVDTSFKVIEDHIGKYSEHIEVLDAAKAFKLDPSFLSYLEGKVDQSFNELYSFMQNEGWIGSNLNKIKEVKKAINELEWSDEKERDHKLFFRSMRDMFEAYNDKMVEDMKPVLQKKNWAYAENMEEGLHEVRRLFRWVMIIMQMRPEAFSYGKPLDPSQLDLTGVGLEVAKASLEDALKRKTPMLDFAVDKKGTAVISPESAFFISGLVDRLGSLKRKSEMYFKLQTEIKAYLSTGLSLPGLNQQSSLIDIQSFIVTASVQGGPGLSLQGIFTPGDTNPFQVIRQQTLDLLEPFWQLESLVEFEESSQAARDYWDKRD